LQSSLVIQNADKIAKLSHYEHLKENELLVHNCFYSLQGEGPLNGRVAFFLRLAGCNYGDKRSHCQSCDTSFFLASGKVKTHREILDDLLSCRPEEIPHFRDQDIIVITGGEPCLQKTLPNFIREFYSTVNKAVTFQIETNGMFPDVANECMEEGAIVVCSPKASAKGYSKNRPTIKISNTDTACSYFKFVVTANPDDAHHYMPDWINEVPAGLVFISPLTVYKKPYAGEVSSMWNHNLVDQEATSHNYQYAAELCIKHGYRLTVQMQTLTNLP
jgi:7-carboxy-7-deazaguanine synthase